MGLEETWEDINSNFEPTPPENPVSPCDSALTPEDALGLMAALGLRNQMVQPLRLLATR